MIIKNNLKNLRKINVVIYGRKNATFKDGKKYKRIAIYDTTPDEVFKIIENALQKSC